MVESNIAARWFGRKKDDLCLVDCAVTGCSHGTLDNPKFPLKALFENKMFPDVEALVGPGGKFEGYVPIFQAGRQCWAPCRD